MKKQLLIIIALLFVNTGIYRGYVVYGEEPAYTGEIDAYIALLKSDVRTHKKAIIMKAMEFSEDESAAFWPVERNYALELSNIFDAKIELIKDYGQHYNSMTDKKAEELVKKFLKLEGQKTKLKRKYFKRFKKVISSTRAAAFLQLESQIERMIDLQISSHLPLIK